MESSNTSNIDAAVNFFQWNLQIFVRCWCPIIFFLGIIGHSLSIYVFTRPTLRPNPCARYFLASAIVGYCIILIYIPIRTLEWGYGIESTIYSIATCKIVTFLLIWMKILPSWLIALASVDRFLSSSSSATLRGWSSLRVASWTISLTTLFIGVIHIHVLVYYTIIQAQPTCAPQSSAYKISFYVFQLIIWSIIPSSAMLVFGFLTIRHVRQGKMRVANRNTVNYRQQILRSVDRQLIQMMLVQSFVFSMTTCGPSIVNFYFISNVNLTTDPVEAARELLITTTFGFIGLFGSCTSFYLFTLSSKLFRRELKQLFHRQQ